MPTLADLDREKSELSSVLSSGILQRAPGLAQVLTYICSKYFEGAAGQIKEYNIAVEALGRPPDFDQKKDSIVRVEAHKLRKRLREYYEGEGATHPVRIEIPPGQYAPRFVVQAVPAVAPKADRIYSNSTVGVGIAAALAILLLAGVAYWGLSRSRGTLATRAADVRGTASTGEIRILAGVEGGTPYVDGFGHVWQSDRFFHGGSAVHSASRSIAGTRDARLYQSRREGAFSYDIPLEPGIYELRLHFAETLYGDGNAAGGGETTRLFHVAVNGKEVLRNFDVVADAGASAADIRVFKDVSPAADGKLHLQFEPRSNASILNAIEITPGTAGLLRPIRLIAQDHFYTDKSGRSWTPDRYARGGQLVLRNEDAANAPDAELYRGERYGNITYTIPVAQGRYGITFYVAEMWFGPGLPGGGGAGSRVFDIICNGVALKRNFDVFREAGGARRAFQWTVHGIEPNHQGKLVISLAPVANYACINALEVLDESK